MGKKRIKQKNKVLDGVFTPVEEETETIGIDNSILIYEAEDGSLGIEYVGNVDLKQLTLFNKYLEKHVDKKWDAATKIKEEI